MGLFNPPWEDGVPSMGWTTSRMGLVLTSRGKAVYLAWDWVTSRMGLVNPPWEDCVPSMGWTTSRMGLVNQPREEGVPSMGLGDFQDGFG